MEHSTRLAHISEDGTRTQTVYDHLAGTARLAGSFAAPFGAQSEAEFAAWLHDVGKYSDAFQLRLKGGPKVDHSPPGRRRPGFANISALPLPWPDTTAACPTAGAPPMTRATPPCLAGARSR